MPVIGDLQQRILIPAEPTSFAIPLRAGVDNELRAAILDEKSPRIVNLVLDGVKQLQREPGHIELFINVQEPNAAVSSSPYYAGSLSFFGGEHIGPEGTHFIFDITAVVRQLMRDKLWQPDKVNVMAVHRGVVMPTGKEPKKSAGALVEIGRASIVVQ